MSSTPRPHRRGILAGLRASFLTGLVVVGPAVLTIWLIKTVVVFFDSRITPLIPLRLIPPQLANIDLPGVGVVIFLAFTLIVGWLAKGYLGRSLIGWSENIVARMPVIRSVYNGLKQIAETVFASGNTSFQTACLVEYPRRGLWAMAFISTDARGEVAAKLADKNGDKNGDKGKMVSVFLPTTPNPTSGFLLFVPEEDITPLDMSVEDAAKLVISAGLVAPDPENPGKVKVSGQKRRA